MGLSPDRLCSLLGAVDARTDADLLGRFVADRDGEAFAALVRRHGPNETYRRSTRTPGSK